MRPFGVAGLGDRQSPSSVACGEDGGRLGGGRGVWLKISGVSRPGVGAADEAGSERALNNASAIRGEGGAVTGTYELGHMGHEGIVGSTSVVTSNANVSDDSGEGVDMMEKRGIRKTATMTATMTVTFEDTATAN